LFYVVVCDHGFDSFEMCGSTLHLFFEEPTCSLMPLLCNATRWLMLMRWFSRRRSSSATQALVWSSTSLELAFDGVLATILLALPCFFSVPLMLEKKFSRLNASSSPTG
jgi:hypothetical protein